MRLAPTRDNDELMVAESDCDFLLIRATTAAPTVATRDIFAGFRALRSRVASKWTRSTSACRH